MCYDWQLDDGNVYVCIYIHIYIRIYILYTHIYIYKYDEIFISERLFNKTMDTHKKLSVSIDHWLYNSSISISTTTLSSVANQPADWWLIIMHLC